MVSRIQVRGGSIVGRKVVDAAGVVVGELDGEMLFDPDTWSITAARVKVRDEVADLLGLSHSALRAATIELPTSYVQSVSDIVLLRSRIETVRSEEKPEWEGEGETAPPSTH
jgi:sporulation protein YlmC with PRC-barrel domain